MSANTRGNGSPSILRNTSPFVRRPRAPVRNGRGSVLFTNRSRAGTMSPRPGNTNGGPSNVTVKKEPLEDLDQFQDFSITACTKEDITDIQYHLMKLQSRKEVHPERDFVRPIRLHRKDPRNMQFQLTLKEIDEREKHNNELKEQELRRTGKSVNTSAVLDLDAVEDDSTPSVAPEPEEAVKQSNVAPDGKLKNKNKRKTREVRVMNEDARKLRYEEYYPWVMEDYDGENTYVGNYEAATTVGHNHALLIPTLDGGFKMVPINKIYRFTPRNKYATLTLEEAEAKLADNSVSRWLMQKLDKDDNTSNSRAAKGSNARNRRFRTLSHDNLFGEDDDDRTRYSDNEGMDFDEEFADDEEAPIVGGDDEEEKESRKRMEKEMLRANTGLEERIDDDEIVFDDEEKKKFDKEGRKLKKTLGKNEYGQIMYDSEDEENPYLSQSDLETSESDTDVKKEEKDQSLSQVQSKTSTPAPQAPQIAVKLPVNNPIGVVTISASVQILSQFPRGEWNPSISKKRSFASMAEDLSDSKPHKKPKNKSPSPTKPASPGSPGSSGVTEDPLLLTQGEIADLIRNNELTTKELFQKLKTKIASNKANKEIFKNLIKKLAKVRTKEDGTKVLMLKNPNL